MKNLLGDKNTKIEENIINNFEKENRILNKKIENEEINFLDKKELMNKNDLIDIEINENISNKISN
jgi:hypothetical protein